MLATLCDDWIQPMSKPKPDSKSADRKPGLTWKGLVPDDHPIYRNGGWNFLAGKNLKPTDEPPAKNDK